MNRIETLRSVHVSICNTGVTKSSSKTHMSNVNLSHIPLSYIYIRNSTTLHVVVPAFFRSDMIE